MKAKSRARKVSLAYLEEKGVDTKVCAECNHSMKLRIEYYDNIPGTLLFINIQREIFKILHRKCKPIYTARLRK